MIQRNHKRSWSRVAAVALVMVAASAALACPFCSVESRTLTEEIDGSEATVLAQLVSEAPPVDENADNESNFGPTDPDTGKATFKIVEVISGSDRVVAGDEIKVVYFGEDERDKTFLISGIGVENDAIEWTTPLPLSPTAIEYVRKLPGLPKTGAERLAFFQDYFEFDDPLLAQDAYDEFARAPYADVKGLKGHMPHDKLVEWIQSPDVNPSRRRLYLTMLGVCGSAADLPMLEGMIDSDYSEKKPVVEQMVALGETLGGPAALGMWNEMLDQEERQKKLGLDATVACYLTLRGPDGLALIDERFLKNPKVEYTHAYMTIMALRFHGEEGDVIPKDRLLASMRLLLDNPEFADQVIPDLSRWEDWSVLDRLVAMYKNGDEKSYVRQPVITYLTVASEQPGEVGERAKKALAELEQLDPEGVKRAKSLMAFGFLARARGEQPGAGAQRPGETGDDNNSEPEADPTAFAASAADQSDEEAEEGDFADPAAYGEGEDVHVDDLEEDDLAEEESEATEEELTVADESDAAADDVDENAVEEVVGAEVEDAPPATTYSRPVVIGVPVVAALLLMSIYWLILRWGAM